MISVSGAGVKRTSMPCMGGRISWLMQETNWPGWPARLLPALVVAVLLSADVAQIHLWLITTPLDQKTPSAGG